MARLDPVSAAVRGQAGSEAAEWLARADAGLTAAEQASLERWLAADPLHRAAWMELQATWARLDRPRRTGAADAMVEALRGRSRRRWKVRIGGATATLLAAAAAWMVLVRPAVAPSGGTVANPVVVRAERRVLEDGSVIELNRGAKVEISYRAEVRGVQLVSGEANFTVAKDPARPFVVTAGRLRVRAVGTEFAVTLGQASTDLLVTEGKVSVARAAEAQRPAADSPEAGAAEPTLALVPAGGLLVVPVAGAETGGAELKVETLPAAEIEHRLEWRQPRVELSGTPLGVAVGVFNREAHVHLSVDDPDLAGLRMSGVFRADNVEGFVRLLQSNYGVQVERRGSEIVLRHAR